jgi:hypothetical protein
MPGLSPFLLFIILQRYLKGNDLRDGVIALRQSDFNDPLILVDDSDLLIRAVIDSAVGILRAMAGFRVDSLEMRGLCFASTAIRWK